jgi:hypothetical protein
LRARDSSHAVFEGISRRPVRARSDMDINNLQAPLDNLDSM